MTAEMTIPSSEASKPQTVMLGGITALAQSAWMGFALASDVLEQLRLAPAGILRRVQVIRPAFPRDLSLKNLLTREYSVGEASFILMTSFFLSAALGAVRQVLFNAQFGVSQQANAYYAAFRLPDTLFSLIAGGALSSAMISCLVECQAKGRGGGQLAFDQRGVDRTAGCLRLVDRRSRDFHAGSGQGYSGARLRPGDFQPDGDPHTPHVAATDDPLIGQCGDSRP